MNDSCLFRSDEEVGDGTFMLLQNWNCHGLDGLKIIIGLNKTFFYV